MSEWLPPRTLGAEDGHVVFVTGGTGFLGRQIVAALLDWDGVRRVVCLVRATSKIPETWVKEADGRLTWVVGDVGVRGLGLDAVGDAVVPSEFTAVIHAAADVKAYDLEAGTPLLALTNVHGTANVLAFAAAHAAQRFVHVSTTSVEHPTKDAYAATKAAAEQVVMPWAGAGRPAVIVRVPLVVGDNAEDWLHRMKDACVILGARPACDFLFTRPVPALGLNECAQDLVRAACHGGWPRAVVLLHSDPMYVQDLLRVCWPTIDTDLPAANDVAWVHAACVGTPYAPLA